MSASELAEHLSYLTDRVKIDAYRAALSEIIRPGSVVLDLGAGTGLLGIIAAQCGARTVYSVDSGPILVLARETAVRSECNQIVHVRGLSTRLTLPEPVDVVVCDQIGGFVYDAGILRYYADAVERLLKPGGVLMPAEFVVHLTAVADPELAACVGDWGSAPDGIDFSSFAEAAANTEHHVHARADCALSGHAAVATISSDHDTHFGGEAELVIDREGEFCGLLGTFEARMSATVTMTNAPWAERPMRRWQNFYPIAQPTTVRPGDTVRASIDVSPRTGMVAWRGAVLRADGSAGPIFAHDTLRGTFAGPEAVIRASDAWVPQETPRARLAAEVLASVDGRRSIADLGRCLWREHSEEFVSEAHARSFVRAVLDPAADP